MEEGRMTAVAGALSTVERYACGRALAQRGEVGGRAVQVVEEMEKRGRCQERAARALL